MVTFELSGNGGKIVIRVLRRELPEASHRDKANWLSCAIDVEAGAFRGCYSAALSTQDFAAFEQSLSAVLNGNKSHAVFSTYEKWLRFDVSIGPSGRGIISAEAMDASAPRVLLKFVLETDLEALKYSLSTISDIGEQFPIVN